MKSNQSYVIRMLDMMWNHNKTNSYLQLNTAMQNQLQVITQSNMQFDEADWSTIKTHYRAQYWLGVSRNGHHYGDSFYTDACKYNASAAVSYEKAFDREPFILKSNRLHEGFEFKYENLYWSVTGWSEDNKRINVVGYKTRMHEGKRKLMTLDRKQWLNIRPSVTPV